MKNFNQKLIKLYKQVNYSQLSLLKGEFLHPNNYETMAK